MDDEALFGRPSHARCSRCRGGLPGASLLKMRGDHDCDCLGDKRRKAFGRPKTRKEKWAAQHEQSFQRRIHGREKSCEQWQAERAAQN
jgi:hypothetical protein